MRTEFVLSEVGIGLRRNITMTLASIVVVWVTLTLLGVALILSHGTSKTKTNFFSQIHVSVYFNQQCGTPNAPSNCATPASEQQVRQELVALPEVKSVQYISQSQALQQFKKEESGSPALTQNLPPNAIPDSYVVFLKNPKDYAIVKSAVGESPGVGDVEDAHAELQRIFKIFDSISVVSLVFALILLVATVLLIYNAMRIAAFTRRRETGIMRLVGATNFAIQVPFILEGTIIGLAGVVLSVALLSGFREFIYHQFHGIGVLAAFGQWSTMDYSLPFVIIIGIVLPSVASFLTLQRHLRV